MITLSPENWDILNSVNREVNKYPYKTDSDLYSSVEFWTYIGLKGGDCEDYVLTKRRRLIEHGFDPAHLLPAIGITHNGEGHCILLIETDKGGYVLDNNFNSIIPWRSPKNLIKTWVSRADVLNHMWVNFVDTE